MNRPVPSGTGTPVLSGTTNPSYQEPEPDLTLEAHSLNRTPNLTNHESFGFLLTPGAVGRDSHTIAHHAIPMVAQ